MLPAEERLAYIPGGAPWLIHTVEIDQRVTGVLRITAPPSYSETGHGCGGVWRGVWQIQTAADLQVSPS
jgi:hypothetical protein